MGIAQFGVDRHAVVFGNPCAVILGHVGLRIHDCSGRIAHGGNMGRGDRRGHFGGSDWLRRGTNVGRTPVGAAKTRQSKIPFGRSCQGAITPIGLDQRIFVALADVALGTLCQHIMRCDPFSMAAVHRLVYLRRNRLGHAVFGPWLCLWA